PGGGGDGGGGGRGARAAVEGAVLGGRRAAAVVGDRPAVGVAPRGHVVGEGDVLDVHHRVLVVVDRAAVAEVVVGAAGRVAQEVGVVGRQASPPEVGDGPAAGVSARGLGLVVGEADVPDAPPGPLLAQPSPQARP